MIASFSRRNLLGVTAVAIGGFATPVIAASTTTKTKASKNTAENSTLIVEEVVSKNQLKKLIAEK